MNKKLATAALSASILGGAAFGATSFVPHIASADTASTTQSAQPTTPPWVSSALDGLVQKGTINQSQASAVEGALANAAPEHGPGGRGGPEGRGPNPEHMQKEMAMVAQTLGISESTLRSELDSGKTLAAIAQDKGIDVNTLIDKMVAFDKADLDQAVKDGKLTQTQADEMASHLKERVTERVNNTRPTPPNQQQAPAPSA